MCEKDILCSTCTRMYDDFVEGRQLCAEYGKPALVTINEGCSSYHPGLEPQHSGFNYPFLED